MVENNEQTKKPGRSFLAGALNACRAGFGGVTAFSLCINILMLTLPLYMIQVFDRVITGRSTETLLYLTLIALFALVVLAALEGLRSRVMVRIGVWLESDLAGPTFKAGLMGAESAQGAPAMQGLRDLGTLRTFLSGSTIFSLMDAPWTPIFLMVIFLLHPTLGWIAIGGALALLTLAYVNDRISRGPIQRSTSASMAAMRQADTAARNTDVIRAMGLTSNLAARWQETNARALEQLSIASDRSGAITALSKFCRFALQMGIMGAAAWLVLQGDLTAGGMIASSILLGRALAPVDQAIGSWKSAVGAKSAYARLRDLLENTGREPGMPLPAPEGRVTMDGVVYSQPDANAPLIRGLSMDVAPGECIGVAGPTATGKTTLARLMVGNLLPDTGTVRLDGAEVGKWDPEDLGRHMGYLPQDVELFDGTVRQNIARMGEGDPDMVIAAAGLACVHEMILGLPQGYDTEIGEGGIRLSGGQRQRIALARALYGDPRLVVLDEPNASLDMDGDKALVDALAALKDRGVTTVVISHRPSILKVVDRILVLRPGSVPAIGPAAEILSRLSGGASHELKTVEEVPNAKLQTA